MDVGLLKAFLEIQRTRHFGRAANNLYISQSAISARIRQLECELGIALFSRNRNNIELTPAGRRFHHFAEQIITLWNRARQDISIPDGMIDNLAIAALPCIWDAFLEKWLSRIPEHLPGMALQAESNNTDVILRHLLDGTIDLGILFDPPRVNHLLWKIITPIPLLLVSNQKDVSVQQALSKDYVLVDWGSSFISEHTQLYHDPLIPRLRVDVGHLAYSYLLHNGGSAYLPEPMVRRMLGKKLHAVKDAPVITKQAYAVYAQTSDKADIIDATVASLVI